MYYYFVTAKQQRERNTRVARRRFRSIAESLNRSIAKCFPARNRLPCKQAGIKPQTE